MKQLALKINGLDKENYDKKIFTLQEVGEKINSDTSRNLKACEDFNIDGTILASEIIHSKDEREALKQEKKGFREQGSNDEKIAELTEYIVELEALLMDKINHGARMKAYKAKEDAHSESVKVLQPLADRLKALEKELKDNIADIKIVEASVFGNPISPETFRLMDAMARPSGVFN